ncbi:hypothetical protein PG991_006934 [Apiospora marii]|uniref:Uncharacterized protein n=1 Tax=Apiospora marii TaxID=335849 RepID=A0ABR1RYX0_9PEZI
MEGIALVLADEVNSAIVGCGADFQSAAELGEEEDKSIIGIVGDVRDHESKHQGSLLGDVCGGGSDAVTEGAYALARQEDLGARLLENGDGIAELAQLADGVHELGRVFLV